MRILVVDDELVSRSKLRKILEKYGDCECASDGNAALGMVKDSLINRKPYDLVTLDVAMPGMDGNDVLVKLRQLEQSHHAEGLVNSKVLMVTAHAERSLVVECIQYGCDDYLLKPFKPEEINKKLRILGLLK